jgi:hypothetical protein
VVRRQEKSALGTWRMPRGSGGGPPLSSSATRRSTVVGAGPASGNSGRVETEWRQQRENPVVGMPQGLGRSLPQQSRQDTAPATAGQSTPVARRARNSQARRRRRVSIPFLYNTPGFNSYPPGEVRSRYSPRWAKACSTSESEAYSPTLRRCSMTGRALSINPLRLARKTTPRVPIMGNPND